MSEDNQAEENVVLSTKAPMSWRDKMDLAVIRHPEFGDRSGALRAAINLFLRTLGLIEESKVDSPVDSKSDMSPAEITIDSVFALRTKP